MPGPFVPILDRTAGLYGWEMVTHSAGVALWRRDGGGDVEVLLVHPGGPFWAGRDEHAWSIPKGEFDPAVENPEDCARREFAEETGTELPPTAELTRLPVVKASGKHIHAFVVRGEFDPATLRSNTTEVEWPPRSGRRLTVPEVDAAAWVPLTEAQRYLHKGQAPLAELIASTLDR